MKLPINGGDRVGWEYHTVSLSRVPVYGFGIAVSGGRDNPHFMNGDPSIAISDVLKAGPAEGKLMVNDRVISVNGVSLENVDYNQAISVLRECGNAVNLLIKRRALVTQSTNGNIAVTEPNNNPIKVTLTKASKKDDFGIVLGCKIYVKEITNRVAVNEKDASLQEGDIIYKINSSSIEGLTLKEARKLLDSCKEKVSLVVSREASPLANLINNRFLSENGNYVNGHSGRNGGANVPISGFNNSHQRWPSFVGEQPPGNANGKPDDLYTNQNEAATSLNNNSGLAAMANGRVSNGWNNQNLYVQPPTRAEYQQMNSQSNLSTLNESNEANDSNSTIGSRIRGPLADISLTQLDQPATPLLASHSARSGVETTDSPARPLPQRPTQLATSTPDSSPAKKPEPVELEPATKRSQPNTAEIRYISFHKEGSVGIRLTGGNEVGIFVTAVQPGSPASLQGLQVGDKILKANGTDMKNFTREEAVLYLLRIQDKIELVVANCKQEYDSIVASQKGDSFYIRVHFNYDSDGKGELSFHVGDIFHVVDTLHNGVVGSWLVYRLGRNNQEIQKGSIPNKSRADELAAEQKLESRSKKSLSGSELNEGKRGNFFKRRRSARRSKSLSKDHWEDVIFGDGSSKFAAYERVTLKHPGFTRPVVFFGPLADIAREKFLRDHPEKYASPQALQVNDEESPKSTKLTSSGIVRLSSIKDVVSTGKHALLDITPSAVDRLNYAQFYPIVIFMRAENKSIVKELRSRSSSKSTVHRSSRKLFDQSLKLEKLWHHIFTSAVTLTSGGDLWYKKLHETIEKEQSNTIWVAETKPEENISDDFLFPMISRLSYASSPESDLDISANDSRLDEEDNEKDSFRANSAVSGRLVKASSDPSLAHPEQAPATVGSAGEQTTDSAKKSNALQENAKPSGNNDSPNQRSPSKQLPLHILLRKELSKALHYESKDKDRDDEQSKGASAEELKQRRLSARLDEVGNYPTLRASDKYPQEVSMYSPKKRESPLPPPPPTTLPPSTSCFTSKGQPKQQYVEAPPRIDRNSKPSRFRSAHERLFGSKSIFASLGNYQNDDSDYINTISPAKYDEPPPPPSPQKATPNVAGQQQRIVTGAFGDSSSYSSDSYNKYGSANSTLDTANGHVRPPVGSEPYKPPRRSAPQLSLSSTLSSKHSSLERNKPLPPPPFLNGSKVEPPIPLTSSFSKAPPPSPPPKPTSKFVTPLQYQMNALTLNDTRPPPPPKPLNMPPPPVPGSMYDKQIQSDYDNMPAMLPSLPSKRPGPAFHGALDISNGPPGYYQSLPQSSYAHHHSKDSQPRYSSTAETISNFINGTGGNSNSSNNEPTYNSFNSLRRPSSSYLEVSGESNLGKSPSKPNYPSNYEHMRYNSFSSSSVYPNGASSLGYSHPGAHNNGPYLNVPYPSKSPYSQEPGQGPYSMGAHGQGSQSSPLPPPPPLPTYTQPPLSSGGHVLQPTPQQPQSGQYLDLSLNRENRGSAFEVYRKPVMGSMHAVGLSDSPLFHGLPPPPPPLTVNDYNQPNYCNLDEITSSAMFSSGGGGHGSASDATVIAAAHGLFDCEGGSLTDRQTGVSLIIPPGAISEGVTQEIYFKVCRDHSLAPPLDKSKGETLLSPVVMCGPRGLRFHEPVELRLPHCIDVDASWSVALKSSDTSNGEPAGWRNISINNDRDGIAGNDFKDQFVTVQVDHF